MEPFSKRGKSHTHKQFLHSIVSQVDVSLNGKLFSSSDGATYAFKTYIQNLLNYGQDAKSTHLQSCLFFKDDATYMDVNDPGGANTGLYSLESLLQ